MSQDAALKDALDTPVMRQYLDLKKMHPESILFFRMGDFYEMFLEDAISAAPILDVALTRRQGVVPMAGIPYHSVDSYLARLIAAGRRVAIAEQAVDEENPKLMRRLVTRVVSPGTVIEESLLPESAHSYLAAVALSPDETICGIALSDITTSDFRAYEVSTQEAAGFLLKIGPAEILTTAHSRSVVATPGLPPAVILEEWKGQTEEGARQMERIFHMKARTLDFADSSPASGACSLVIHYLMASFPTGNFPLPAPVFMRGDEDSALLDEETVRNLELTRNQRGTEERTLFSVLNRCRTAAGRRLLRECLLEPLKKESRLIERLDAVEHMLSKREAKSAVESCLNSVRDLERIIARLSRGRGGPQDFHSVRSCIQAFSDIEKLLGQWSGFDSFLRNPSDASEISTLVALRSILEEAVVDDPPAVLGGAPFIREGIRPELDLAMKAREEGAAWVLAYEEEEKAAAGIPIKVRFNRIHGYYIEVTKSYVKSVPDHFKRRQTLLSAERYTTDRLSELEEKIQGAEGIIEKAEKQEFERLSELVLNSALALKHLMNSLASVDVVCALASTADRFSWTRPEFSREGFLDVSLGRHPVVEAYMETGDHFVPNSLSMRGDRLGILTGPNMAGKSTFIRQTALIQLLAQIGSFVPAGRAVLPLCDGIFTRIGASDNLSRGESTFFVEMIETARILRRATAHSLVILDEVGRGTSTYDGLSIAWAIVEALSDRRSLVLFATHYHELTALDQKPGIFNLTMDVREIEGKIHFLRKVREGAADRSYGIHVAELAGIPDSVLRRAKEKLFELESRPGKKAKSVRLKPAETEPGLF